jgi:hypothetical protein
VIPWIIGFDLSLSAPAAVALPLDWRPGDWKRVKAWAGSPKKPENQDDLAGHAERYIEIAGWASDCICELGTKPAKPGAVRAYVESYGFSKNNANASRIMESGGHVRAHLYQRYKIVLHGAASSAARKLSLGFNPRKPQYDAKVVVQDTVFNRFKAPKRWTEDQCDAFLIAQFGLSEEGGKILAIARRST